MGRPGEAFGSVGWGMEAEGSTPAMPSWYASIESPGTLGTHQNDRWSRFLGLLRDAPLSG